MYQFIETISIEDGIPFNLINHQKRLDQTRKHFFGEHLHRIHLKEIKFPNNIPGIVKGRVVYGEEIIEMTFAPYNIHIVNTLQMIKDDTINYPFKSTNRTHLTQLFDLRGNADDVLIIKNNHLTDTSIGNIALLKNNQWYTPSTPLLKGTRRKHLLDQGLLKEAEITLDNFQEFTALRIFNAMIPFGKQELTFDNILPLK